MLRLSLICLSLSLLLQSCFNGAEGTSFTERKALLTDSTSFYAISVEYPEERLDAEGYMKSFATDRFNAKKEEWKTGGEIYEEEAKITREFPDRAGIKYTYDVEFEQFLSKNKGTVSYLFTTYEYTGGANGNTTVNSFNFSKNKKKLEIEDILDLEDSKDIELTRILAEKALSDTTLFFRDFVYDGLGLSYLKSDGKTLDTEKCNCDGFFFGSNFQNFIIKDKGITFFFSKYAIAPGAAGVTRVTLTWEELNPFLKEIFLSGVEKQ